MQGYSCLLAYYFLIVCDLGIWPFSKEHFVVVLAYFPLQNPSDFVAERFEMHIYVYSDHPCR